MSFILIRNLLVFISPIILLMIMLGASLMQNSIAMFFLYYAFLFFSVVIRKFLYSLTKVTKDKESITCPTNKTFLIDIFTSYFGEYNNGLPIFLFLFTIVYLFLPVWLSKSFSVSSISLFLFLIIYMVYDSVIREMITSCNSPYLSFSYFGRMFREFFISVVIASGVVFILRTINLSNYLYFSPSSSSPINRKRKVFRCGKINR